jgi:phosphomannomutase
MKYLVEKRGLGGLVVQTLTLSEQVKRLTAKYGLETLQTPVGFKYVAELMVKEDILIGGEESGGLSVKGYIPERDGILLGFLLVETAAAYGKTLGQLLDEMAEELGYFAYDRRDLHLDPARKDRLMKSLETAAPEKIGGKPVQAVHVGDGIKLEFADGWVIFRGSGTEPIVRVYCEAQSDEAVQVILKGAVDYAEQA